MLLRNYRPADNSTLLLKQMQADETRLLDRVLVVCGVKGARLSPLEPWALT